MRNSYFIAILAILAVASSVFAGTEYQDMEFKGRVDIMQNMFRYGNTAVTATADELNILDGVTATAAELNLLAGGIKSEDATLTINAPATITNGQAVALVAGEVNQLKASGGEALTTNTITFSAFSAANVGKITYVFNSSLSTNYIYVAQSGTWKAPALRLEVGEGVAIIPIATNAFYAPTK